MHTHQSRINYRTRNELGESIFPGKWSDRTERQLILWAQAGLPHIYQMGASDWANSIGGYVGPYNRAQHWYLTALTILTTSQSTNN